MADDQKVVPLPQPEKWVAIKSSDAQAILNYLAGQPCGQVYSFVTTLLNLKECEGPKASAEAS